jgi:hypothetical protein
VYAGVLVAAACQVVQGTTAYTCVRCALLLVLLLLLASYSIGSTLVLSTLLLCVVCAQVKGLKFNDFCFIPNQPITAADTAAVASADSLASTSSSSSSDASLTAAKQQQQQLEMQPRWVASCCYFGGKVSAASAAGLAF